MTDIQALLSDESLLRKAIARVREAQQEAGKEPK